MGEDARRTIEEADILRLSRADQIAFAEALINPPGAEREAACRQAPACRADRKVTVP